MKSNAFQMHLNGPAAWKSLSERHTSHSSHTSDGKARSSATGNLDLRDVQLQTALAQKHLRPSARLHAEPYDLALRAATPPSRSRPLLLLLSESTTKVSVVFAG